MYNWSVNIGNLNKNTSRAIIWRLEQTINFGLNGEKLSKNLVKRYWKKINLDPSRKKLLQILLWPRKS
ncbi:MAG: hypothetical protein COT38_00945 [Candidatus Omnitrophica bacterium CG08_land_8_20_14_0_20_41_16]|uniref:Uncharacterized protein n=1 Tax=Candidatus Sherwoodlollariibacterium unditelluris TaxID=1974757 RepID=A0A2G9YIC7_9BACT|nr:MAG: hypothetical protein COX41_05180 [Candidatus Omnitrophica bacterium CG23_combo_of_CG06-09_8_20_14_all_41_10]PIS34262.1 MAG: hypothetical protein COT38_00945 [Candidatus Omnitrophica bacterium CG08_land_8_20_14_0_20_41_16]